MKQYCCVPGCSSRTLHPPGVTFHAIPSNIDLRAKWITIIRIISWSDWLPRDYDFVCSKHFVSSDFTQTPVRKRVLSSAVPSQFPEYQQNMQKPPETKRRNFKALANRNQDELNQLKYVKVIEIKNKNTLNSLNLPQSQKIQEYESSDLKEPVESSVHSNQVSVNPPNLQQSQKMQECGSAADKEKSIFKSVQSPKVNNKNSFLEQLNLTPPRKIRKLKSTANEKQLTVRHVKSSTITSNNSLNQSDLPESQIIEESESTGNRVQLIFKPIKCSVITNTTSFTQVSLPEPQKMQETESAVNKKQIIVEPVESSVENDSFNQNLHEPLIINIRSDIGISAEGNHKCIQVSRENSDASTWVSFPPLKQKLKTNCYRRQIKCYQSRLQRNLKTIERVKEKLKETKEEILSYKADPYIRSLTNVLKDAESGDQTALYIQDLVLNYKKNKFKCVDIPIQDLVTSSKGAPSQLSLLGRMIMQHSFPANYGKTTPP